MNESRALVGIRSGLAGLVTAVLWGLVEVIALARSRWSHGRRG
jgi:hypothetical protein